MTQHALADQHSKPPNWIKLDGLLFKMISKAIPDWYCLFARPAVSSENHEVPIEVLLIMQKKRLCFPDDFAPCDSFIKAFLKSLESSYATGASRHPDAVPAL